MVGPFVKQTLIRASCGEISCASSSFFLLDQHFPSFFLSSFVLVNGSESLRASHIHFPRPKSLFYGYVSLSFFQPRCTLDRRGVGREALSVPVSGSDDTARSAGQQLSGGNVDIHSLQKSSPTLVLPVNRPSSILCLHHTGSQTFPKSSPTGALHPVIDHFSVTHLQHPALYTCIAWCRQHFRRGQARVTNTEILS